MTANNTPTQTDQASRATQETPTGSQNLGKIAVNESAATDTKPIPKSKLMWTGAVITLIGIFSPKVAGWLNANQEIVDQVVMVGGGFLVMLFRRYSSQPVQGFVKKDE